jgi:tetratricopeptide (TPR) repeat protein
MRTLILFLLIMISIPRTLAAEKATVDVPCSFLAIATYDAQAVARRCTELIESGPLPSPALARAYLIRILAHMRIDAGAFDNDQLIAEATKVIEIEPRNRLAYQLRGGAYFEKADYRRALEDTTKSIELDPTDWNELNVRAAIYSRMGEHRLAIADNNKAVEIAPQVAAVYSNRSSTYQHAGEMDNALRDINKAISLSPRGYYYFARGKMLDSLGRTEEAIADYRSALRLEPNHKAYEDRLRRLGASP